MADDATPAEPLLLRALRREATPRVPIWIMRQAGRYLPQYRAVRAKAGFLELCHDPALAAQVTLDAVTALDVDAAILFSDILIPAEAMGAEVAFDEHGPTIRKPFRGALDLARLRIPDPRQDLPFVAEALQRVRADLATDKALLGFAGAPFTLASYLVEGQSSRDFEFTKALMLGDPRTFHALLAKIAEATIVCLRAQIEAGAQAVQLFDSWAGHLAPDDYETFALPHARTVFEGLADLVAPTIYYVNGGAGVLESIAQCGADCIGVDWRVPLDEAWRRIGHDKAIQGNLDPGALLGPPKVFGAKARAILEAAGGRPGFVFNLGHGISRHTPPAHAQELVRIVKEAGIRPA